MVWIIIIVFFLRYSFVYITSLQSIYTNHKSQFNEDKSHNQLLHEFENSGQQFKNTMNNSPESILQALCYFTKSKILDYKAN